MESTGKYWIHAYNILEVICKVVLAHPEYVKAIRGKKTDKKDAQWIADLFKHDLVASSFMPPLPIRQLRDLMRYRFKLINFMTSEKTVSRIALQSPTYNLEVSYPIPSVRVQWRLSIRIWRIRQAPNSISHHSSTNRCWLNCLISSLQQKVS